MLDTLGLGLELCSIRSCYLWFLPLDSLQQVKFNTWGIIVSNNFLILFNDLIEHTFTDYQLSLMFLSGGLCNILHIVRNKKNLVQFFFLNCYKYFFKNSKMFLFILLILLIMWTLGGSRGNVRHTCVMHCLPLNTHAHTHTRHHTFSKKILFSSQLIFHIMDNE